MKWVIEAAIRAAIWIGMWEVVAHLGFGVAPTVTSSAVVSGAFLVVIVLESILEVKW